MYAGFAYALTAHDGSGRAVCPEDALLGDLEEVYMALSDFVGWSEADGMMAESLERLYVGHYGEDAEESTITWEVRCIPLLQLV